MSQVDQNQNDNIDYSEFVAMTIDRKQAFSDNRIESCFKMFDVNGDGQISLREFKHLLQGN